MTAVGLGVGGRRSAYWGGKPGGSWGGLGLKVWMASTLRLIGKTRALSKKVRDGSIDWPPRIFLTGISLTSPVKNLTGSMTGDPSAAKASTGKAIMIVPVFMASTAAWMVWLGSAIFEYETDRSRTLFSRSPQRTTMF